MRKMPLIYAYDPAGPSGGSHRTRKALEALSKLYVLESFYVRKSPNKFLTFMRSVFLYAGALWYTDIKNIEKALNRNHVSTMFFDTSLHGRLVKYIKKNYPTLRLIVNFHNNETAYYKDMMKTKGVLYLPLMFAAYYNDALSAKYMDYGVFITQEDKDSFKNMNKPYTIIPATFDDARPDTDCGQRGEPYLLFIGSGFYANVVAARFIIDHIAPLVPHKIVIAGDGMEKALKGVSKPDTVIVKGYVEDLAELYLGASAFVCPVFLGSGMKVKIAEALMYGKKIIASTASLTGYETNVSSIMICNTAREFVDAINGLETGRVFYPESRRLFLEKYDSALNVSYYSKIRDYFTEHK